MLRYTFWHGVASTSSDLKWVDEADMALQNNTWTKPLYIDGSGWHQASIREETAQRLFRSLSVNTSVSSLVFQNAKLTSTTHEELTKAVDRNKGLRVTMIRNLSTDRGIYEIPETLFSNLNLERLSLTKVALNLGACQKLSDLIRESSVLHTIALNNVQIDPEGWLSIMGAIFLTRSLKSLSLIDIELIPENIKRLLVSVSCNRTLTSLHMEGLNLDSSRAPEVADFLRRNRSVTELSLRHNRLDSNAMEILVSRGLLFNETLKSLFLSRNPLGNGSGQSLAQLLSCKNATLRKLCLVDTKVKERDCEAVAKSLRRNNTLTSISMDGNELEACGSAMLESLESNTTLLNVLDRMSTFLDRQRKRGAVCLTSWKKVEFYLRANRANRRFVPSLQREQMPYLLEVAETQTDVLFHFVRNSGNLFSTHNYYLLKGGYRA